MQSAETPLMAHTLKEKHQKRLKDAYETVVTIPEIDNLAGYGESGTANLTTNYSLNSMFHYYVRWIFIVGDGRDQGDLTS